MIEPRNGNAPDYRPALIICAYDADEQGWDPVEDLSGEPWHPNGARTLAVAGGEAEALATLLSEHLGDGRCKGLLLVGRTTHSGSYRLQIRAENRSPDGSRGRDGLAPSMARATAPITDMVRDLTEAGLAVTTSSESEDDAGSYLLYRVLSGLADGEDTPAIGLLRAPAAEPDEAVQRAVKVTAQAMARHLSPLTRARAS
jgi:hypothetical protein